MRVTFEISQQQSWRIRNSHANQSVSISEERFCFRRAFRFQNAVFVSEYRVPILECRFCFRILRFDFRMPFLFRKRVERSVPP